MKGHWAKDPPTEPGWYWVIPKAEIVFITMVYFETLVNEYYTIRNNSAHKIEEVRLWWSERLDIPPLPNEELNG